ncbi:hypothetical protein FRC02_012131 [Tulasnella sp. 418]|nr:hypothetical protein FRC02_012131 [Tulasnella sp. 418]
MPPSKRGSCAALVVTGEHEMEEGDNGTLEFGSATGIEGGGGECLPDDALADVGGDKEGDTGSKTVALLKELIKEDDDESSDDELEDGQQADTCSEIAWLTVESTQHIDGCLPEGDDERKHFKRSLASPSIQ